MTATVDNAVADLQRANAELQRQLDERTAERNDALARETATAEVLGVINSSPGDIVPVFDAMLEKAVRLCGATYGTMFSQDGDRFRAAALRDVPEQLAEFLRRESLPLGPDTFVGRVMRDRSPLHIADITTEEPYRQRLPIAVAGAELGGCRTILTVPLLKDDALLGIFQLSRQEVRPFSDKQIALVENFAAQAVIAMENARLITETREALEQQTATAEVLQVINSSPGDLTPVFEAILEKAHTLCGATHGSLTIYDGELFHAVATHGMPEAFAAVLRRPRPGSQLQQRLQNGERLTHIADMKALPAAPGDLVTPANVDLGIRTLLFVPLRKDGGLLGYIAAHRKEVRPFSEKEMALLENFAAQAVIAIENARLIAETREALEQQTATAEVLQVINSSPGDLAPVFDAILEKAHILCGAAKGALVTFDGDHFRAVATHGLPAQFDELIRQPRPASAGSAGQRLLQGERLIHIPDQAADVQTNPIGRASVELCGTRTLLFLPLRKDETLLGYITAFRQEVRPFTDKQIALLQNFAAQAVIAMENARLLGELRARTDEIAGWNRELEARVAAQLAELERTGRLRRFLAPQLADLIVAQGDESILESHRREIVVVFCDLRGFTPFAERAEPEEVMALLKEYHAALGPIVASFEGTLDHYSGDGVMVFFNDPLPTPEPAKRAIEMALAMREAAQGLLRTWRRHGHDLGFGVGISQGYAALGQIGFAERMDYTAIGTVTNLAARLCAEAKDGQILISARVATAVEDSARPEEIGDLSLKGLSQAVAVFNVPQ